MATVYVHGHAIDDRIQLALIEKMKEAPFRANVIEAEAVRLGVPSMSPARDAVAMRVVDRIIQREKKAGNIQYQGGEWKWTA